MHFSPSKCRSLSILESLFVFRQAFAHRLFDEHLLCAKLLSAERQLWTKTNFWFSWSLRINVYGGDSGGGRGYGLQGRALFLVRL